MFKHLMMSFILVQLIGCAPVQQATPEVSQHIHVREVPNQPKHVIFQAANLTLSKKAGGPKFTITYSDSSTGIIVANGILPKATKFGGFGALYADIEFVLTTEIKDGKIRFSFESLEAYSSDDHTHLRLLEREFQFHQDANSRFIALEDEIVRRLGQKNDW